MQSRSVFIKNLNFSTSETALKQHLQRNMNLGSLRSVVVSDFFSVHNLELLNFRGMLY